MANEYPQLTRVGAVIVQEYERYLPTAFDESMSILQKLNKVIEYMNQTGILVNSAVDLIEQAIAAQDLDITALQKEVADFREEVTNELLPINIGLILQEWFENGKLAEIINGQVFGEINDNINLIAYDIRKAGAINDGVFDNKLIIQGLLNDGHKNLYIHDGVFLINNALLGLIVDKTDVKISGKGTLKATHEGIDLITIKNSGSILEDISIEGNGNVIETNQEEEKVALVKYDGRNVAKRMNFICRNVKFINPHTVSVQTYNAVGGTFTKNKFTSTRNLNNLTTTFTMHVLLSGSAYIEIEGNDFDGMAQGLSGSGFSTATTFNDFAGEIGNKTRHIKVKHNNFKNHYDHAIYFSDECKHTLFDGNTCLSRNDGIKVEGSFIKIVNNYITEGLSCRNVHDITIDNNDIVVTQSTPYVFGILLGTAVFKRNTENVKITNNRLTHMGGESHSGIWLKGEVWDGFQNRMKNILIKDNTVVGFGNRTTGSSIHVDQNLSMLDGLVVDSVARTILIVDNILETSDVAGLDNYGIKINNAENVSLLGNVMRGMTQTGVYLMGVRKLITDNNRITMSAVTGFTKTGILERPNDLTVHVNSEFNVYGNDEIVGANSEVLWANESSKRHFKKTVRLFGASSQTLRSYHNTKTVFKSVPSTGQSYTLGNLSTSPFSLGDVIEIYNFGTVAFNVEPQGLVLAGGERVKAHHDGAGVFTYFKK